MEVKDPTPSVDAAPRGASEPPTAVLAPASEAPTPTVPLQRGPVPSIGRVVLFRLPPRDPGEPGDPGDPGDPEADPPVLPRLPRPARPASVELRPALMVNAWPGSSVANLVVFLDPANDFRDAHGSRDGGRRLRKAGLQLEAGGTVVHVTSAVEGSDPGQWRWPPRV